MMNLLFHTVILGHRPEDPSINAGWTLLHFAMQTALVRPEGGGECFE